MAPSSVVSSSSLGEIKMNETKILRPSFSLLPRLKLKVLFFCLGHPVPGKSNSEKRDSSRRVENVTTRLKT